GGQTYTADTWYASNPDSYIFPPGNPPTFSSWITYNGTTFTGGSSLTFPTSLDSGQPFYYGPNFSIVSPVPEPSTGAASAAVVALAFAAWRRRAGQRPAKL